MSETELKDLFLEYFADWSIIQKINSERRMPLTESEMNYLVALKRAARMAVIEYE